MNFGQLIEYNLRNISSGKSYANMVEKTFPDPFLKNENRAYLWINSQKFYSYSLFLLYLHWN